MSTTRKDEHIKYATLHREVCDVFKDVHIIYDSLPELDFSKIDTTAVIFDRIINAPIIINAITGGSENSKGINAALSFAAAQYSIPIAVGSQSIAVKDKSLRDSFTIIRKMNKNGIVLSNVGANVPFNVAKQAVEMLEANALQLHLNVLQELVMEEGDRDFSGIIDNIRNIYENVGIPVIVKEVGFGMTGYTAKRLKDIGIEVVDIGGFGGTNFARIENLRRSIEIHSQMQSIGVPTAVSLYDVCKYKTGMKVICGGGIRNGLDITKALIMGADLVSIAYPFLKAFVHDGANGVTKKIEELIYEFKICMTASGAGNISSLKQKKIIITGNTLSWINQM